MKIKNLVFGFVLSAMVLFAGNFTTNTVKADGCIYGCMDVYNACEAACNGNRACVKQCKRDYYECACSGCGLCEIGPLD